MVGSRNISSHTESLPTWSNRMVLIVRGLPRQKDIQRHESSFLHHFAKSPSVLDARAACMQLTRDFSKR